MTEELPEPPVPADLDHSDFPYMPLHVARLRDSKFVATVSREAGFVAVLLWGAAWHQKPASSLPDDDRELAHLGGYGRDVEGWKAIREQALYGFIRCSDGRLYHPTIAECAIDSWHGKQVAAWGKECDRIRKENKKRRDAGDEPLPIPPKPERPKIADGLPSEFHRTAAGIPRNSALNYKGTVSVIESLTAARPEDAEHGTGETKPRPKTTRMPTDWKPSERGMAIARERGHDEASIADIIENFKAQHTVGPRSDIKWADWDRAFENWARKEFVRGPGRQAAKRGMAPPAPAGSFAQTPEQIVEQEARIATWGVTR
jgi:hypothetical protein